MTRGRLIFNSLTHHARAHAGTLLGAIVAGAVLTGSLVVGDSVKKTLQNQAQQRLGKIQAALVQHDRFFRADLATAIHLDDQTHFAPVLKLNAAGYVADESGEVKRRANQIQLIGIDESFWNHAMLKANRPPELNDGEALINPRLAAQLGGDGRAVVGAIQRCGVETRGLVRPDSRRLSAGLGGTIRQA